MTTLTASTARPMHSSPIDIEQLLEGAGSGVFMVPGTDGLLPKYIAQSAAVVKVDELPVLVERLGADGGRQALEVVVRELHAVPPEVREGLVHVLGAGGTQLRQFAERGGEVKVGDAYTAGEYDRAGRTITLYGLEIQTSGQTVSTLDHELGHHIANVDPAAFRGWAEVQRRDMDASHGVTLLPAQDPLRSTLTGALGITNYGATSAAEDIAESLALLRLDNRTGPIARRTTSSGDVPVSFAELYPNRTAAIMQSELGAAFVTEF